MLFYFVLSTSATATSRPSCHVTSTPRIDKSHSTNDEPALTLTHQCSARIEVAVVVMTLLMLVHVLITALVRLSVVKEFDFQFAKSNKSEYIFCCEIKIINYNPIMLLYIHPPIYTLFSVDSTPPLHPISICSLDGC